MGTYACSGDDGVVCDAPAPNACGGCETLSPAEGTPCTGPGGGCPGIYACTGADADTVACNAPAANACGGCTALAAAPKSPCTATGGCAGTYVCAAGNDAVTCTPTCPAESTCSGGACVCSAGLSMCNGACVNEMTDSNNCGACFSGCVGPAAPGFVCEQGFCTCGPTTPDGTVCYYELPNQAIPSNIYATCLGGACLLTMMSGRCTTDAECVPGGCVDGVCLGTIALTGPGGAPIVSCNDALLQCTDGCSFPTVINPTPVACGNLGTGSFISCDSPDDCGPNEDCCQTFNPGLELTQECYPETNGVVGSACPALVNNETETTAAIVCDPRTPNYCPAGQTCQPGGTYAFVCE